MTTLTASDIYASNPLWNASIATHGLLSLDSFMPSQEGSPSPSRNNDLGIPVHPHLLPIVRALGQVKIPNRRPESNDASERLAEGLVIADRHIVQEWLGDYSITQTYRVRHAKISTFSYILKTIKGEYANDPDVLAQFHREASTLASLRSEYVAQVIDMGTLDDGRPFLCLEIIPGLALNDLTRERGAQPEPVVWHIASGILCVLDEIHQLGITHGNVQPVIVRLWKDPSSDEIHPRILDFSTIRTPDSAPFDPQGVWSTQYNTLVNSDYSSPECSIDASTPACDVYSTALLIIELLDGALPHKNARYNGNGRTLVLGEHSRNSPIAPVLERALQYDPAERYSDAGEMLHDLVRLALEADPHFVYQMPADVLERYGNQALNLSANAVRTNRYTERSNGVSASDMAAAPSPSKAGEAQTNAAAATIVEPDGDLGTVRMHKVPAQGYAHDPEKLQQPITKEKPALDYRMSFAIRTALILGFLTVAVLILLFGLPA